MVLARIKQKNDGEGAVRLMTSCFQKRPLKMECGVTGPYTNGTNPSGILSDVRNERSPSKTGLHVNFKDKGEIKERREKFLTAKYGHHQMSLIRKRLAVEMWLYEELKKLYETTVSSMTFTFGGCGGDLRVGCDGKDGMGCFIDMVPNIPFLLLTGKVKGKLVINRNIYLGIVLFLAVFL